jgi:hypothetical protein
MALLFPQSSEGKGDSKGKKTPTKPLKILEEDDEDLSALKDPSEKVSSGHSEVHLVWWTLRHTEADII